MPQRSTPPTAESHPPASPLTPAAPAHLPKPPPTVPVDPPAALTEPHDVPDRLPREIWVLVACAFVIAIGFGFIAPALPQFAVSFGVDVLAATFLISSFALTRLAFAPASGWSVDTYGERPTYLWGLLIVALSTGACSLAQSYEQLLLFRSLGGIGSTMFTVSAAGMIVRFAPASMRGRASATYASAFLIGGVIGPVLGGALGGFGLRVPFAVYAVLLLIAVTMAAVMLRGAHLRPSPDQKQQERVPFLATFLGDSAYRAAVITGFGHGWANFGVRVALIPLFAVAAFKADPAGIGLAMAAFAAGNALALTLAGSWSDRWGRKPLILVGIAVSTAMTAGLGWITHWWLFLTVSLVAGLGAGLYGPSQQAVVADVLGKDRRGGRALAGFQMAMDVGAIIGPLVAGLLAQHFSYGVVFASTAVIMALGGALWMGARETHPVRRTAPAAASR